MLTKAELIKASGVPRQTLERWLRTGKITPADVGNQLFAVEQVEQAKALHQPKFAPVKKTAPVDLDCNDFDDTESISESDEAPATVVVESEVSTESTPADVPPVAPAESITLADRADKIRRLSADVQRGIIEIGLELIEAKKQIEHGGWQDWLQREFQWTQRTANNFMRIAERFGTNAGQAKMENVFHFQPSTLQAMLTLPPGTEDDFIEEQAAAGRPVESQSAREVKANVKEFNRRHAEPAANDTISSAERNNFAPTKFIALWTISSELCLTCAASFDILRNMYQN